MKLNTAMITIHPSGYTSFMENTASVVHALLASKPFPRALLHVRILAFDVTTAAFECSKTMMGKPNPTELCLFLMMLKHEECRIERHNLAVAVLSEFVIPLLHDRDRRFWGEDSEDYFALLSALDVSRPDVDEVLDWAIVQFHRRQFVADVFLAEYYRVHPVTPERLERFFRVLLHDVVQTFRECDMRAVDKIVVQKARLFMSLETIRAAFLDALSRAAHTTFEMEEANNDSCLYSMQALLVVCHSSAELHFCDFDLNELLKLVIDVQAAVERFARRKQFLKIISPRNVLTASSSFDNTCQGVSDETKLMAVLLDPRITRLHNQMESRPLWIASEYAGYIALFL